MGGLEQELSRNSLPAASLPVTSIFCLPLQMHVVGRTRERI